MVYIYRFRTKQIIKDLEKKMVFIVGPRQVGKTHLAKEIGKHFEKVDYLNYDFFEDKKIIKNGEWNTDADLIIFDELHKMKDWKNWLKGVYDTKPERTKILVTGSARLETFRKSGDSMAGRFFVHHLMPFCPRELNKKNQKVISHFLERSGFPEPFLAKNEIDASRWRKNYIDALLREDVYSLKKIVDIKLIENILEILQRKVGSPISYSGIARDVSSSHVTIKSYIDLLESLYIIFKIPTYSKKIARTILKEKKIYFFDTGLIVGDDGIKFENFVAVCLLKECLQKNDFLGENNELMYLRDKEGREVDFALVNESKEVEKIIEAKLSKSQISKHLKYFKEKYNFSAIQIVKNLHTEKEVNGIKVMGAEKYFLN